MADQEQVQNQEEDSKIESLEQDALPEDVQEPEENQEQDQDEQDQPEEKDPSGIFEVVRHFEHDKKEYQIGSVLDEVLESWIELGLVKEVE